MGEKLTWNLPRITVCDGEKVTVADVRENTRIVATKIAGDRKLPIHRTWSQGSSVQATVIGIDDAQAVVDSRLQLMGTPKDLPDELRGKRCVTKEAQIIDCVEFGKPAKCQIDGGFFEIVVKPASDQEADEIAVVRPMAAKR